MVLSARFGNFLPFQSNLKLSSASSFSLEGSKSVVWEKVNDPCRESGFLKITWVSRTLLGKKNRKFSPFPTMLSSYFSHINFYVMVSIGRGIFLFYRCLSVCPSVYSSVCMSKTWVKIPYIFENCILQGGLLQDDSPTMLPQFENHVSCLLRFWEK